MVGIIVISILLSHTNPVSSDMQIAVFTKRRGITECIVFHFTNHDFDSYGCVYFLSLAGVLSIFLHKSGISQLL